MQRDLLHYTNNCSKLKNIFFACTENSQAYSDPELTLRQDDSSTRPSRTAEKTNLACPVATLHHATNHGGKLCAKGHMCTLQLPSLVPVAEHHTQQTQESKCCVPIKLYLQTLTSLLIFTFMIFLLKTYLNYKYIIYEQALKNSQSVAGLASSTAGSPAQALSSHGQHLTSLILETCFLIFLI